MPQIQGSVSIAAGATNTNVLAGSVFEYLPYNAQVEIGLQGSATGLQVTVTSGSDVLMEESPPGLQNRMPLYPDDYLVPDVAGGGERLVIKARNTSGGALTLFYAVRVAPLV